MAVEEARIRLVAGLGNPGAGYAGTRHNIGFAVLDHLADQLGAAFVQEKKWEAAVARASGVVLVKPLSFMNRSGEPLGAVAHFYRVAPPEILVALDDMALPLGRLRIRPGGGTGGHNGLDSVIVHLATDQVPRLRLGIGAAPERGSADYVLGRFFEEERAAVQAMIARAGEATKWAIDNGVTSAMNKFNKAEEV